MAVPKKKVTRSRAGKRRAGHKNYTEISVQENSATGTICRPHHISPDGFYRGKKVTDKEVNC